MGRRALRKIDPNLDLSQFYRDANDLPERWDRIALFGNAAPVEVEIGSGKGLFLSAAAGENPDHNFLGIEIARKYARFIAARLARRDRQNAKIVHGDATPLLRDWIGENEIHAVHIYFPDPWWKKRHHKRRIMNEQFISYVHRVLQPGGTLHFWTDVEQYFAESLELLANSQLDGPFEVAERTAAHDLDYRTHFERRMRLHNQCVQRSQFRKPATQRR